MEQDQVASDKNPPDKVAQELAELRSRVEELEEQFDESQATPPWRATEYYPVYYATTGVMLGMVASVASLMVNILGSLVVGLHPLQLVRVYLTFPLGERALQIDSGLALAIGCCLYIATGMLLGIPFHMALTYWTGPGTLVSRLKLASLLAIAIWIVNFYLILSWLQPLLIDGRATIVREIPWYVGAFTHLVFGWTMAVLYPLGLYWPYERETDKQ